MKLEICQFKFIETTKLVLLYKFVRTMLEVTLFFNIFYQSSFFLLMPLKSNKVNFIESESQIDSRVSLNKDAEEIST